MRRAVTCFPVLVLLLWIGISAVPAQEETGPSAPAEPQVTPPPQPAAPRATPPPAPPVRRTPPVPPARRLVPSPVAQADRVSINFSQADLIEVIHVIVQHLGLNYTIHPDVQGKVTIYSAEPLKKEDLLPIFHQILRMNGAVAVKSGELYRIVPIKDGKGVARPADQGKEDSYALQVVPVRFFSVSEMKKLLTPFVTPGGEILDYPRGNFLIIVDLPSNIQRLMEIRDLIDVQVFAGTRMEIYQPKVASAEELATELAKIMQAYASSAVQAEGFAAQFLPIPRINQLLVISHSEAAWTYAKRWLERIDVVAEGPGRRIFIYPVENSKATDLADTLNQVLGTPPSARREVPRTLQDLHRATPPSGPGAPRAPLSQSMTPGTTPQSGSQSAFAAVPVPEAPRPPVALPGARPTRPDERPDQQLRIVADPATNSLIVFGTAQEFQNIKNILKDLDIMPRQVLMEVLVAEVTLTDDTSFGIEYEILKKTGVSIFGHTFPSQGGVRSGLLGAPSTTAGAITQFGSGISGVAGRNNAVRAFINALMSDSRVKILASPHVLATDNRPARIQVGSEEPIPTGIVQAAVGSATDLSTSTSIQFRNTGRIVTIIPQVNAKGLVNLQIKAEVSERGANVQIGAEGNTFPSFNTRDAETTAVVQDGETLVIGGIISDRVSRDRVGIPFLMNLPVFGRFFGTTTDNVQRTELVMLITPHVIRSVEEARSVTEEFKDKVSTVVREIERMRRAAPAAPPVEETVPEEKPAEPETKQAPPVYQEQKSQRREPAKQPAPIHLPVYESNQPGLEAANGAQVPEVANGSNTGEHKKRLVGVWAVQVAAFAHESDASSLAKKLVDKGYDVYVTAAEVKKRTWYRVQVGQLATREQARELQEGLKRNENYIQSFLSYQGQKLDRRVGSP